MLTLRTSVKSSLLRRLLFRGTILAGIGMLLWVFSGIFFPVSILQTYGFLILAVGITLIVIGMVPYRRLKRLETEPNTIEVTENTLDYSVNGRLKYQIPLSNIQEVIYIEDDQTYGIGLRFHKSEEELFLPYFSKRAQMQLCMELSQN